MSYLKIIGLFFKGIFSWVWALPAWIKWSVLVLALAGYGYYQHAKVEKTRIAALTNIVVTHNLYAIRHIEEIMAAIKLRDSKQEIWNLFVANAGRISEEKKLETAKVQEKVRIEYVQLKAENPLPADCKFSPAIVQYANQAITKAIR